VPGFVYSTPVRFADVDHAGIVYYPRFFHYFHLAFEELWRQRLGARAYVELLDRDRVGFPAVHADCDFKSPLRFGDTADIELTVTRLGDTSVTFQYRVFRGNPDGDAVLCAQGTVVCAVVDLTRFRAVAPPAAVRELLASLAPA
jgi:4-hydroxybenzoyl-CoA thioesterase